MTDLVTTISDERLAELLAEVDIEQEYAVANAEADQNPMLAVDAVGEFALSDMASVLTELQSLRAHGGLRVKPLHWERTGDRDWVADCELGQYTLNRDLPEAGGAFSLWMAGWESVDDFDDFETEKAAKAAAQADYERRILSAIEVSPAPVSEEMVAENKRLREAIDYYEIGVCAVGVPHEAERKVLHDCVRKARAALAAKGGQ